MFEVVFVGILPWFAIVAFYLVLWDYLHAPRRKPPTPHPVSPDPKGEALSRKWILLAGASVALLIVISPVGFCAAIVCSQVYHWAETGVFPERDLFWLLSDGSCAAAVGEPGWFGSKDVCRQVHLRVTASVGINDLINWLLGRSFFTVGFLAFLFSYPLFVEVIEGFEELADDIQERD